MSLFSRFFYRRPPDGLLEFAERVYVFDSCFSTEVLPIEMYNIYLHEIVTELHEEYTSASFLAFNFREGQKKSHFAELLCEYDVTVMDYPRQYEGCPVLPLTLIQHFLCVCENWLSSHSHQNIVLLHCERGGWPILAFLLCCFLLFRKLHSGEQRILEMVHREAPKGFLQLLSPLNPFASQLRYAQYISRRRISTEWPPEERALSLDCLILRAVPSFDSHNGCRPIIRVFGRNLRSRGGLSTHMLFTMSKKKKNLRHYRQGECDVIKVDIQCLVQGDAVLECLHVDVDSEREVMMFRLVFNTAFIRSNIMMLNREDLDILWDSKKRFPKGFRAEVIFGEVDSISTPRAPSTTLNDQKKGGLPIEVFSTVKELFSDIEWVDSSGDDAALWLLKQFPARVLNDSTESLMLNEAKEPNSESKIDRHGSIDEQTRAIESRQDDHDSLIAAGRGLHSPPPSPPSPSSPLSDPGSGHPLIASGRSLPTANVALNRGPTQSLTHPMSPASSTGSRIPSPPPLPSLPLSDPEKDPLLTASSQLQTSPSVGSSRGPTPPLSPTSCPVAEIPPPPPPPLPCTSGSKSQPPMTALSPLPPPSPPASFPCTGRCSQPSLPVLEPLPPPAPPPPPPPPLPCTSGSGSQTHPIPVLEVLPPSALTPAPPLPCTYGQGLQPPVPALVPLSPSAPPSPPQLPCTSGRGLQPSSVPLPPPPPPFLSSRPHTLSSLPHVSGRDSQPSLTTTASVPPLPPPLPLRPSSSATPLPSCSSRGSQPPMPPPLPLNIIASSPPPPPPLPPRPSSSPPPCPSCSGRALPPSMPPSSLLSPPLSLSDIPLNISPPAVPLTKATAPVRGPPPPPPLPPPGSGIGAFPVPPLPPPPPPPRPGSVTGAFPVPPPLPQLHVQKSPSPPSVPSQHPKPSAPVPPPPPSRLSQPGPPPPPPTGAKVSGGPIPSALVGRGRGLSGAPVLGRGRGAGSMPKKSLKPLHWVKVTRAVQGSLWADSQKQESLSKAPEFDLSELETLFSNATASEGSSIDRGGLRKGPSSNKPEIVHMVDLRRANNCEIMLTKIKMPLRDMMNAVLALDASALDIDQVDNLIKFCPSKEEMEMLKNYNGNREMLGKCEQFFLELMRVPRIESKLRVFSFTITFATQVKELRANLNTINFASEEVKNSDKLRNIMKTILNLGNALNQGTARGCAVGFKLDSLLKLTDTRSTKSKMTLMHYLCKVVAEQKPELLDFSKDLIHLEAASKIQLKSVAEEMQAISKGLEKVYQELTASDNDGAVSVGFQKALKTFLDGAEAEVRSLASLYSEVGRSADSLALYFGEDPTRCPFEQVTTTLMVFINIFQKAHEENVKVAEAERKKIEKETVKEKSSSSAK